MKIVIGQSITGPYVREVEGLMHLYVDKIEDASVYNLDQKEQLEKRFWPYLSYSYKTCLERAIQGAGEELNKIRQRIALLTGLMTGSCEHDWAESGYVYIEQCWKRKCKNCGLTQSLKDTTGKQR